MLSSKSYYYPLNRHIIFLILILSTQSLFYPPYHQSPQFFMLYTKSWYYYLQLIYYPPYIQILQPKSLYYPNSSQIFPQLLTLSTSSKNITHQICILIYYPLIYPSSLHLQILQTKAWSYPPHLKYCPSPLQILSVKSKYCGGTGIDTTVPTNTLQVPITTGTVTDSGSECTGFIGVISLYIYLQGR